MKKILQLVLSAMLLCLSLFSNAQQKIFPDSSVLKLPDLTLQKIGNNNHFDIYTASPDNMIVIKPDSTIQFTMPNAAQKSIIIQTPFVKPKEK